VQVRVAVDASRGPDVLTSPRRRGCPAQWSVGCAAAIHLPGCDEPVRVTAAAATVTIPTVLAPPARATTLAQAPPGGAPTSRESRVSPSGPRSGAAATPQPRPPPPQSPAPPTTPPYPGCPPRWPRQTAHATAPADILPPTAPPNTSREHHATRRDIRGRDSRPGQSTRATARTSHIPPGYGQIRGGHSQGTHNRGYARTIPQMPTISAGIYNRR
jgi:hypothetical protein